MIVEDPNTFIEQRVPNLQNTPVGTNLENAQIPLPSVILPTSQITKDPTAFRAPSVRRIIAEATAARQRQGQAVRRR
jgi:hypothetical protein